MSETAQEPREVPKGYKEVQLGPKLEVIPSDWEIESLSNWLSSLETGGRAKTSKRSESDSVLSIGGAHISDGSFDLDDPVRISEAYYEELNSGKIEEADILLVKDGATIGKSTYVDKVPEGRAAVNSHVYILRVNHNQYDPRFLYNFIRSRTGLDQILRLTTGTAQAGLNRTFQQATKVPTAPLPEQRRIAEILSTVDEQIQQTDKIIEETKALKHGLMQDLLIRGVGHDCFKQVYFGPESVEIPASWDVVKLGDVVDQYRGGASLSSNDFTDDGVPVIPKGGINQRGVLRIPEEDQQYCSNEYAHSNKSSLVSEGDLVTVSRDLVSSAPNIGRVVEVPDREYIISQGVNAMEINDDQLNPQYLINLSNSHLYRNHMKRIKVGSTQVHIRKDDFLSTPIPCPPIEEQREIVDVLSAAEQQIREEIDRKSKLQELKRGFMQDLLTGKVRVPVET